MAGQLRSETGEILFRHVNVAVGRGLVVAAFAVVVWALYLDVAIRHDPISVDFHTYLAAAPWRCRASAGD